MKITNKEKNETCIKIEITNKKSKFQKKLKQIKYFKIGAKLFGAKKELTCDITLQRSFSIFDRNNDFSPIFKVLIKYSIFIAGFSQLNINSQGQFFRGCFGQ